MRDEYTIGVKGLPLKIDTVSAPSFSGLIGISACPGMKEFSTLDLYDDRIENDLQCISNWGAKAIVTVLDIHEMTMLGVTALPTRIVARNIAWLHLPMSNHLLPEAKFDEKWYLVRDKLLEFLQQGERILIHCKEGVGRSALVAVRLLIEAGFDTDSAIKAVRKARPGSLMLYSQEKYCQSLVATAAQSSA
jgi:ADP-ribosyl-[dinitrogen reductase] hydrolase